MVISLRRNGCTDRPATWSTDCGRTLSPKAQSLVKNTYRTIPLPEGRHQGDKRKNQRHILTDRRPSTAACPQGIEIVYGGHDKNLLFLHDKPNEPAKEIRTPSFVLFESPFTSVSTVSTATPLWSQNGFGSGHDKKTLNSYIAFNFYHKEALKQDHYVTHLLSFSNTVL
jgi:hypothetical protein